MDDPREPDDDQSLFATVTERALPARWTDFFANRVAAWREWRFAKQATHKAMNFQRLLLAARPNLNGRDFYEVFVCEYARVESAAARTVLRRAEASFAAWPNERELAFRDVVAYLLISEYLRSHPKRSGTTAHMARVISNIVPKWL
jgi:hypothetical protein